MESVVSVALLVVVVVESVVSLVLFVVVVVESAALQNVDTTMDLGGRSQFFDEKVDGLVFCTENGSDILVVVDIDIVVVVAVAVVVVIADYVAEEVAEMTIEQQQLQTPQSFFRIPLLNP